MPHSLDAVALSQAHLLVVLDLLHGHALDAVLLLPDATLSVADLLHAHSLDGPTLSLLEMIATTFVVGKAGPEYFLPATRADAGSFQAERGEHYQFTAQP